MSSTHVSEYRARLESKIDGMVALDRSGYGATYGHKQREVKRETYKSAAAMLLSIVSLTMLCIIINL